MGRVRDEQGVVSKGPGNSVAGFPFCLVGILTWLLLVVLEALGERHFHKCKLDYLYVGTLAIVVVVGRFAYTEYPVHRH